MISKLFKLSKIYPWFRHCGIYNHGTCFEIIIVFDMTISLQSQRHIYKLLLRMCLFPVLLVNHMTVLQLKALPVGNYSIKCLENCVVDQSAKIFHNNADIKWLILLMEFIFQLEFSGLKSILFICQIKKKTKKQRVFNKQHLNNYCISNDWPNNNSPVSVVKIQT